MITPQNGIFAQGTHAHYFLELDIRNIAPERVLKSFRRIRAPDVSAGGVNFVLAFGSDYWRSYGVKTSTEENRKGYPGFPSIPEQKSKLTMLEIWSVILKRSI